MWHRSEKKRRSRWMREKERQRSGRGAQGLVRHRTASVGNGSGSGQASLFIRSVKRIERMLRESRFNELAEYYEFNRNPRRIIFVNLTLGIARGVGFVLGISVVGTLILALLTWLMARFLDIPVIGKFVAEVIESARTYLQNGTP